MYQIARTANFKLRLVSLQNPHSRHQHLNKEGFRMGHNNLFPTIQHLTAIGQQFQRYGLLRQLQLLQIQSAQLRQHNRYYHLRHCPQRVDPTYFIFDFDQSLEIIYVDSGE